MWRSIVILDLFPTLFTCSHGPRVIIIVYNLEVIGNTFLVPITNLYEIEFRSDTSKIYEEKRKVIVALLQFKFRVTLSQKENMLVNPWRTKAQAPPTIAVTVSLFMSSSCWRMLWSYEGGQPAISFLPLKCWFVLCK